MIFTINLGLKEEWMNVRSFVSRTIEGLAYALPESVIHPLHLKITSTHQINFFPCAIKTNFFRKRIMFYPFRRKIQTDTSASIV